MVIPDYRLLWMISTKLWKTKPVEIEHSIYTVREGMHTRQPYCTVQYEVHKSPTKFIKNSRAVQLRMTKLAKLTPVDNQITRQSNNAKYKHNNDDENG